MVLSKANRLNMKSKYNKTYRETASHELGPTHRRLRFIQILKKGATTPDDATKTNERGRPECAPNVACRAALPSLAAFINVRRSP